MANLKAHIRAVLMGNPTLASLVGTRIFSGRAKTGASLPFLMLFVSNTDFLHHLRGSDSTRQIHLQVDCMSADSDEADTLVKAVEAALNNYTGTKEGTVISASHVVDIQDDTWSDDVGIHRTIADFKISYADTTKG
jgi:hypothetical protein